MSCKIPFGKHKGSNINEIPDDYLAWLEGIAKDELKQECLKEIVRRFKVMVQQEKNDYYDDLTGYVGFDWWK